MIRQFRIAAVTAMALSLPHMATAADVIRSAAGANAAGINTAVNDFRTDVSLGGGVNAPNTGPFANGRREINWDGVPDARSAPNNLNGDFFNNNSKRGALLSTPGSGFQVSANSGVAAIEFDNINPTYSTNFSTFSAQRLFTALDSNITDVTFFVPTSPLQQATVRGFGAVFTDVDNDASTHMEFFDINNQLVLSQSVSNFFGDGGLSFLGVTFDTELIARVRIFSGNAALSAANSEVPGNGLDLVAMDDFIYGEPQAVVPEPGTILLLVAGAGLLRRRIR